MREWVKEKKGSEGLVNIYQKRGVVNYLNSERSENISIIKK